ncbi:hypothetical protein [Tissierella praeacuta]|uniref:hypothetical protein n=1 Tax=Tissierella praeacuta TaxID=43131 RepID=UPI00334159A3
MIIKKIAVGNLEEAFIEDSLSKDFNIISSDDNNKGKTIIIQSLMYALGNDPTFPSSFSYKNYFHFVEFEIGEITYFICRRNDGFVLKTPSALMIFDNVSELKRYWKKNIFTLPKIYKNEMLRIADPVLFLQLFFVGQDKKATFNISNAGYYNKIDFINMLFDFCDLGSQYLSTEDIITTKKRISQLKEERTTLLKQHKILKSPKTAASYLSAISDKTSFGEKIKQLDKVNDKITELRKERNIAATRKARWEATIKELRSLNRTIDCGELRCMDCDSTSISFSTSKKSSYAFDVSTVAMRNEIINSINEKIASYNEEIEKLTSFINKEQDYLQKLMFDDNISLESIVAYKNQIVDALDTEIRIKEIDSQLDILNNSLNSHEDSTKDQKEKQNKLIDDIVSLMIEIYTTIDPNSNSAIDGIFTKRDEVFSGSEATIFHLAKLYAIQKNTSHNFPIVVDSFRAEDLSTSKEKIVLDLYKEIQNQKIFTTTLKTEELGKYDDLSYINSIDYTEHMPSKMLNDSYNLEFRKLLSNLSIELS